MAAMFKRVSHSRLSTGRPAHGWRTTLAAALLTVATYAVAQEFRGGHPDTYVVQRGDTLWDIAGKFLKRPWLWPEIWQANPQIRNPHLIYPGDVLSLAYLDRLGLQAGPRMGEPIGAIPLAQIEPFLRDLRIYDRIDTMPYVVGLEEDRLRSAAGQIAYVRGMPGVPVGQRFAVLRPVQKYTQGRRRACCFLNGRDDLDYAGRKDIDDYERFWTESMLSRTGGAEQLGLEMARVNAGVVTRGEVGGIEVTTLLLDDKHREVRVGDKVVPVETIPYDLQFFPHPPRQQMPYGKLTIVSVADMLSTGGPRDVVAISGGAREGIDNGTVFSIWRVGTNAVDRVQYPYDRTEDSTPWRAKVRLPDEFSGHVMVFRTFDKISYGLVMDSVRQSRVGYELKHPDAPY